VRAVLAGRGPAEHRSAMAAACTCGARVQTGRRERMSPRTLRMRGSPAARPLWGTDGGCHSRSRGSARRSAAMPRPCLGPRGSWLGFSRPRGPRRARRPGRGRRRGRPRARHGRHGRSVIELAERLDAPGAGTSDQLTVGGLDRIERHHAWLSVCAASGAASRKNSSQATPGGAGLLSALARASSGGPLPTAVEATTG